MTGLNEVGIENLHLVSEHKGEFDEEHGWQVSCFEIARIVGSEIRREKFGYAAVHLKDCAFKSLFGTAMLDPKSRSRVEDDIAFVSMLLQVESCFKDALQETVDTLCFWSSCARSNRVYTRSREMSQRLRTSSSLLCGPTL